VVAWHFLGEAQAQTGERGAAVESQSRALALRPDFVEAALALGQLYGELGRFPESISVFDQSLKRDPRNLEAVIPPRVDHHVRRGGHVAGNAFRCGTPLLVPMVLDALIALGRVALSAGGIALVPELLRVGIVAIAAGHASLMHAALHERAPDEYFALLLSVGMVETLAKRHRQKVLQQLVLRSPALGELTAS
jgi:tetratricopeptide (TPR) repeat protein